MKITIPRADLARMLTAVSKAVETRNTIPILANVLLSTDGDRLSATATDLDIAVTASGEATVATPGAITVDARRLTDIARTAVGDAVVLESGDGKLSVKCGRSRFNLPTLPATDFPEIGGGPWGATFDLDAAALFAPVRFAVGDEQARYYLCGVYLYVHNGKLRAVATDGHRLGHHDVALPDGAVNMDGVIVPSKTIGLVPPGVVNVSTSSNKIRFAAADIVLTSKLIDGTFPDYVRVIPHGNDKRLVVDRTDLRNALANVTVVSSERGRAVKLSLAGDKLTLSVNNPDEGDAVVDVAAEYDGEPMEIGFNSKYLADILPVLTGESVKVDFADAGTPGIFRGDGDVLTLVMPMRVS